MFDTLVVVNPASASGRTGKKWPSISQKVKEKLPSAKIHLTQESNQATHVVREALKNGIQRIVSVGGDGTHHEVINGFLDEHQQIINPSAKLAIIPMGTGSDLCRSLGLPRSEKEAIEYLFKNLKSIDLGLVTYQNSKGITSTQAFVNIGSFGLSAEVGKQLEKRQKSNKLSYISGIYYASSVYNNEMVQLELIKEDGSVQHINSKLYLCAVGNGRFFGGGMKITPTAFLNDGVFEVAVLGDLNAFEVVTRLPALFQGKHIGKSKIESFPAVQVNATAENADQIWIEVDGEPIGTLPAQFRLLPSALLISVGDLPALL
jgi:diacylglycerol kinase (ATP)